MGWASGYHLFGEVWAVVRDHIPVSDRTKVAMGVIAAFEDHDCDTLYECVNDEWPEIAEAMDLLDESKSEHAEDD